MDNARAIHTYTGRSVDPFASSLVDDVCIEDIAHSLSNVCRFNGHTIEFYSVAQHSIMVALWSPIEFALWGLLHDASEAYLGDMARPLKYNTTMGAAFLGEEEMLLQKIAVLFSLAWPIPEGVRQADTWMLCAEARDLCGNPEWARELRAKVQPPLEPVPEIQPWRPEKAETEFLLMYYRLLATVPLTLNRG